MRLFRQGMMNRCLVDTGKIKGAFTRVLNEQAFRRRNKRADHPFFIQPVPINVNAADKEGGKQPVHILVHERR